MSPLSGNNKMRLSIKNIIVGAVNNKLLWPIIKPFAKLGFFAVHSREAKVVIANEEDNVHAFDFLSKKEVLHGPFKGMKYPSFLSVGSSFYPKLLGSYERELHETLNSFSSEHYTEILDIGCAEGYYAVGLALKFPNAKVFAYDTEEIARESCHQMAKENNVADQLTIGKTCTAKKLANFKFSGKALIVCDCEGYENTLFDPSNIKNLKNCDIIIETHDFIDIHISTNLTDIFKKSHHIKMIKSIDDIEKAKTYQYEETAALSLNEKKFIYQEWRPTIMEWLICTPKNQ